MNKVLVGLLLITAISPAQAWRDRINHARGLDQQPSVEVAGGEVFTVPLDTITTFEKIGNFLKTSDIAIAEADPVIQRITTEIRVDGGFSQTGKRIVVTCIKDSAQQTSVRVAATVQTRKQLMGGVKPWSAPKLDQEGTEKAVIMLKASLNK